MVSYKKPPTPSCDPLVTCPFVSIAFVERNQLNKRLFPGLQMGAGESKGAETANTAAVPSPPAPSPAVDDNSATSSDEEAFKEEVRKAAGQFKNLVQGNKVMIFSASYCGFCTVAKKTLDEFGTQYQSLDVDKMGREGDMLMNVVSAVTGKRLVPAIFICGQAVPGGSGGLKHLANSGQLTNILEQCCEGDATCSEFASFRLHGH